VVAGSGEAFGINSQGVLWQLADQSYSYRTVDTNVRTMSMGRDANGHDDLWYLTGSGELKEYKPGWARGFDTGKALQSVTAGKEEAFGTDWTGNLWEYNNHNAATPSGGWSWLERGFGGFTTLSVGTDAGYRDEVWGVDASEEAWRFYSQAYYHTQGGYITYDFTSLDTGGQLRAVTAGKGEAFGIGTDGRFYLGKDVTSTRVVWGAPRDYYGNLLAHIQSISVGTDSNYAETAFLLDSSGNVYRYWRSGASEGWYYTGALLSSVQAGYAGQVYGIGTDGVFYASTDNGANWRSPGSVGNLQSISLGDSNGYDEIWMRAANGNVFQFNTAHYSTSYTGYVIR
jgi:hypothetical protein